MHNGHMTTTDHTLSEDYELARRLNDSIDVHYVDARRRMKNYRRALDLAQGPVPTRPDHSLGMFERSLKAMQDVLNRTVRTGERPNDMEDRHAAERTALADRHEHERTTAREARFRALVAEDDAARRSVAYVAAKAGAVIADPWHADIAVEQAEERALLRGDTR